MLGRTARGCTGRDNDIHLALGELGGAVADPLGASIAPSVLHDQVLAFGVAKLAQPLAKGVSKHFGHIPKIPDPGGCRLLLRNSERHREQAKGPSNEGPNGAVRHGHLLRSRTCGSILRARSGGGKAYFAALNVQIRGEDLRTLHCPNLGTCPQRSPHTISRGSRRGAPAAATPR